MKMSFVERLWIELTLWRLMQLLECAYSAGICTSPQYVKLGTRGMISCAFPETFFGVYWYGHENVTSDDRPLISFVEGSKSGPGYDSNEYDIHPNGSLVINNVSVLHNHFYGVTIVRSIDRDPMFHTVSVVVFENPVGQYPNVGCEDEKLCFLKVKPPTSLSCTIDRVGDIIDLSWILRTRDGNESTSSQQVTVPTSANELQSHRLDLHVPLKTSPSISLYVCSANSSAPEVDSGEAAILVDHGTSTQKELSPILLEKSVAENVTMECGDRTTFFLVWQKNNQDGEPIAYAVSQFAGERIHKTNVDGFVLEDDNSLTINALDELSVGIYICLYSQDGTTTSHLSYEVTIQENGNEKGVGLIIFLVIFITMLLSLLTVGLVLFCLRRRRDKDTNGEIQVGERLVEKGPDLPTDKRGRVVLSREESEDTHRNTLQLLKNASELKVKLENSFLSVENNGSALRLTSNVLVDPIATMRRLDFDFPSDRWREFDKTEVKHILKYAARCKALEEMNFVNSLLPFELKDIAKEIKTKAMIEWTTGTVAGVKRLNFKTGKWENNTGELIKADYAKMKEKAKQSKNDETEQSGEEVTTKPLMQDGDAQADC